MRRSEDEFGEAESSAAFGQAELRALVGPVPGAMRLVALDGAVLAFDRDTGLSFVFEGEETAHLVQHAPRAVQFGITNGCNLACSFCSRDVSARSTWTADTAFELLRDLADAGVTEVAFGGGEPFAFRGFADLVLRLHDETPLAVSATTNGLLVDDATLRRLRPAIGQLRLSLHEENDWRRTVERLVASGVRFGVNLLVTPARMPELDRIVLEVAARGGRDVLLLGYHGPDEALRLSPVQRRSLGAHVHRLARALPAMRFGLDVCFGERAFVPIAKLGATRTDCGAGRDFLVVTSDRRVSPCSFHHVGFPIRSAADVLAVYTRERAALAAATGAETCARTPVRRSLPLAAEVR